MLKKIIFFGGFEGFSEIYLNALKKAGFEIVLRAEDADLGVIAYYGKIIPKAILELPKHGFLNAH
ncbi:MAG: formyltransferase family protein, partial [bacterium]|nr:formyltransferase family protein [bacterium]